MLSHFAQQYELLFELSLAFGLGFGTGATFVVCIALVTLIDNRLAKTKEGPLSAHPLSLIARFLVFISGLQAVGLIPIMVFSSAMVQRSDISPFIPLIVAIMALVVIFGGWKHIGKRKATLGT